MPLITLQSWLCLAACTLGFTVPARPATQPGLEYDVKAAFLLNFTRFIDWPDNAFPGPDSPFTICIIGVDPFGHALDDTVAGEAVNGRKIVVRRFVDPPRPRTCQEAFVDSPAMDFPRVLTELGTGVLTVGEGVTFARNGGAIAFVIQDRRVRFDINVTVAAGAGLRLSSKLMSVARTIRK
jgi:hypothetical protein